MINLNDHRELFPDYIQSTLTEIDSFIEKEETKEADKIIERLLEYEYFSVEYDDDGITEIEHVDGDSGFFKGKLKEALNNESDEEVIDKWNEYCNDNSSDDQIYENTDDQLEELFSKVGQCVRAIFYGDYDYSHKYIQFNGYANLESFDDIFDKIDVDGLIDHLIENEDFDILD